MSNIDKQALREAAEKAGGDKWQAKKISGDFYVIRSGSHKKQLGITSYQPIAEIDHKPVRDFVASANPEAVLALLDELEAAEKLIAEQRTAIEKLETMTDNAHDALSAVLDSGDVMNLHVIDMLKRGLNNQSQRAAMLKGSD
ncbi:Ead/Ea22-like protein [Yokenella regensburgei]|uniref:Ead/Ea22-like protein n=1 Tax=Yokenella regensburgei TaxID=158877 RepID=A0ABX9RZL7_9ENTR|nr:ead/Ea22-like family protein [Yokenella regensburgei]RKR64003.1 Ead/Ea22-like protein [Yokenella regensburgei]VFS25622.1 Uncharacterised protein [Yokenella regensburgei]